MTAYNPKEKHIFDPPPLTFRYERRPVWIPILKMWDNPIVAVDDQAKALVWRVPDKEGLHSFHVFVNDIFALFYVYGKPVHLDEEYRADHERNKREAWVISSIPMRIWNPSDGECPVSETKLQVCDVPLIIKMKRPSKLIADFIHARSIAALAWWPDYIPLSGPVSPRLSPRPIEIDTKPFKNPVPQHLSKMRRFTNRLSSYFRRL